MVVALLRTVLLLSLLAPLFGCAPFEKPPTRETLELRGKPYDRGFQYGERYKSKIHSFYATLLTNSLFPYLSREQPDIATLIARYAGDEYKGEKFAYQLLLDSANRARASKVAPIIASSSVSTMARLASEVHVDAAVLSYLNQIVSGTRDHRDSALGVSMRGALALARASKTWAISRGRTYVTPDDVRELAVPVLAHRIIVDPESEFAGVTAEEIVTKVLVDVAPPAYRAA